METISYVGNLPTKSDVAMEDVADMQRKIIYTEIWHCFSVSCGVLIAVIILMLLVTAGMSALKWSWLFLMPYHGSSELMVSGKPEPIEKQSIGLNENQVEENQSKHIGSESTNNDSIFKTDEPQIPTRISEESCNQIEENQYISSKDVLLPSGVTDTGMSYRMTTYDEPVFGSDKFHMQECSYSSNNLPVAVSRDNDQNQIGILNCVEKAVLTGDEKSSMLTNEENNHMLTYEENAVSLPNARSSINEDNIYISRKCKPKQQSQICDDKCEPTDNDDNDPKDEIEFCSHENIRSSLCNYVEICFGTEAHLSSKEENEAYSHSLDLAPESKPFDNLSLSTEREDSRVTLDDELAQYQLNCLLNFDSDDDNDDMVVTDSDMTIPKVSYDHDNFDEHYWRKQQEASFCNYQDQQLQKNCPEMKDCGKFWNDLDKNTGVSILKYENVSKEFNKYNNSINSHFCQSENMNYPVCSYSSSNFGHQVQSVCSITNDHCCKNHENSSLYHNITNDCITVSFCFDTQRNVQDKFSSFRFKSINSDSLEKSCQQFVHCDQESCYQKIHDRKNVEAHLSVVEDMKEFNSFSEQKDMFFPLENSIALSIYNGSLSPDMLPDHYEIESYLENRNEFETALDLKESHTCCNLEDTHTFTIDWDQFGCLKMTKRDFSFAASKVKYGKNRNKLGGKKFRSTDIPRQRYGILMDHCRKFFRRISRNKQKRYIRDVISSKYINIYYYNGKNRNMNEGTVFMNNEQHPPSNIRDRELSRNTFTEARETESYLILPSGSLSSYFQRISEQQTMSTIEKMQFEWMRLQSFAKFPSSSRVSPLLLAKWGYFATGNGDETMTFCCQQKYRNWQSGDDPQSIHRQQSPSCRFLLGIDDSNIPVHGQTQGRNNLRASVQESVSQFGSNQLPNGIVPVSQSTQSRPDLTGAAASTAGSATVVRNPAVLVTSTQSSTTVSTPVSSNQLDQHAMRAADGAYGSGAGYTFSQNRSNGSSGDLPYRGSSTGTSNDTLGIFLEKPRYPNYAVLAVRISSFAKWPSVISQTPREMSLAGFFYAGYGDYVRCFFCGGGLRNWDSGDDPWVEHARWFPRCAFVRQNRGDAFVDLVLRRHAELEEQENQTSQQSQHTVDHTSQHSSDDMSSTAARSIIEMGFSEDTVRAAIEKFKNGRPPGRTNLNAAELLEFILNEQSSQGESVNNSRQQAHSASIEPQQAPAPSHQTKTATRQQTEPTSTSQQPAPAPSAAAQKTKEHKTKNDKKKKKKEKAAEKQQPEEQEKATDKTKEQKKEEDQPKAATASTEGEETRSESFSALRAPDSLDQMTLEEVRSLQEENAQLREQTICKICMDKNVSMAFLPCGHLACCGDCAPAMRTCPICRQLVKGTVKTYLV